MNEFDEINEILRLAGLPLLEAEIRLDEAPPSTKRLLPMFQGIIQANPRTQEPIMRKIEWARRVLGREDRIVWYLRLVQSKLYSEFTNWGDLASSNEQNIAKSAEKKLDQIAKKMGIDRNSLANFSENLEAYEQQFTHSLSMPIANIQRYVWDNQRPDQIIDAFKQAEDDWREDQDRTVPEDPDAEVVMDFGDGYAWYNLNKAYCSKEADAMGHCGNSPRSSSNDHIISLRRRQTISGEEILTPVLTFILRNDGQLTEMKGRGNEKPAARYHKYIVPLLRSDVVEGITGGGYMPESNFSLNDLEDEVADELRDEKPGLAGPTYWIEKAWESGDYEGAANALEDLAGNANLDWPGKMEFDLTNAEKGMHAVSVKLGDWESYEDVANNFDDEPVEGLFKMLDELNDLEKQAQNIDQEMTPDLIEDILEVLPKKQLAQMAQELGIRGEHPIRAVAAMIDTQGENGPYYDMIREAISRSVSTEAALATIKSLQKEVKARLGLYAAAGLPIRPYSIWLSPEDDNDPLGKWDMIIGMRELMSMIEASNEGDEDGEGDEMYHEYQEWASEGIRIDYEHANSSDFRGSYSDHSEHELVDASENDPLWDNFDEDEFELIQPDLPSQAAQRLSSMLSTGMTPAMPNDRQGELSFESEIRRIRELAGILYS